jgi:ubiquitin-like 1-activating enzyme E1 A
MHTTLSTGESAIYDRQIRLWGSSAQMRIKSGRVLVMGLTPTTVEIAKNVVLAGSNVLLEDSRAVSEATTNFLISLEIPDTTGTLAPTFFNPSPPIGLTVGEATATALHHLNEHPEVHFLASRWTPETHSVPPPSVIVISLSYIDYDIEEAKRVSDVARSIGAGFFLVIDSGAVSWMFSDFGPLHLVEEYTPPLKRDERTGERKVERKQEEFEFIDFRTFLGLLDSLPSKWAKKIKKSPELVVQYTLLAGLLSESETGEKMSKRQKTDDENSRKSIFSIESFKAHLPSSLNDSQRESLTTAALGILPSLPTPPSPHTSAILGAVTSQEIIKYITKRDPPLVNTVLVNPSDCSVVVDKVPLSLVHRLIEDSKEDDVEEVRVGGTSTIDVLE